MAYERWEANFDLIRGAVSGRCFNEYVFIACCATYAVSGGTGEYDMLVRGKLLRGPPRVSHIAAQPGLPSDPRSSAARHSTQWEVDALRKDPRHPHGPHAHHLPPPHQPSEPAPAFSRSQMRPLSAQSQASGPPPLPPTPYQLEINEYIKRLHEYSAASKNMRSAQEAKQRKGSIRNFLRACFPLLVIPYFFMNDWVDHMNAMHARMVLNEARERTSKCKTVEVKRL